MSNKNKNAASRGGSRSLLSILLILITVAACAFAGYMFWQLKLAQSGVVTKVVEPKPAPESIEPLYLSMNTFTVSLKPTEKESDRVLFLGVSVRLADRQSLLTLEKYLPEYRSRLFMLLTHQTYEALSSDQGKQQLIENIKSELSKPLAHNQALVPSDVLINEFILR